MIVEEIQNLEKERLACPYWALSAYPVFGPMLLWCLSYSYQMRIIHKLKGSYKFQILQNVQDKSLVGYGQETLTQFI